MLPQRADAARVTNAVADRMCSALAEWRAAHIDNASPAAVALAELATASARAIQARLETMFSKGDPPLAHVVSLKKSLLSLNSISETVQQSTHPSLHPVLSPSVESLMKDFGLAGQVLVAGDNGIDDAYEISTLRRENFAEFADDKVLDSVAEWPFYIFNIPRPPLDWALHYPLILHEIGHAVFQTNPDARSVQMERPAHLVDPMAQVSEGADQQDAQKALDALRQAESFDRIGAMWLEELFADVFGFLAIGPAYASAFCHVVGMASGLESASETHPPPALRIEMMRRIAEPKKYLDAIPRAAAAALAGWFSDAKALHDARKYRPRDRTDMSFAEVEQFLYLEADKVHAQLVSLAERILGSRLYGEKEQGEDSQRGARLAELDIPIVENDDLPRLDRPGSPLSAVRILAGHWIAQQQACEEIAGITHSREMNKFADKLLGSLDAAEALRAWNSVEEK